MKECPKCEKIDIVSLGTCDTSFFDELSHQDVYGCNECGLIFLDCKMNDELRVWAE